MGVLQQVFGALGALFLVALVLGYLGLNASVRRALASVQERGTHLEHSPTLERISLRAEEFAWRDADRAAEILNALAEAGFRCAGQFAVEELPSMRLLALVHPADRATAVVYEHEAAGIFFELIARYEDGSSITYSTAPRSEAREPRPGHARLHAPLATASGLIQRFFNERREDGLLPVAAEEFAARFEQAYADQADWRRNHRKREVVAGT